MNIRRYIGDRNFYKMVAAVALPIVIQNAITNFVNLLDNMMVGQIGTLPMSAVSISNQLLQIINLAIIGSVNAVGIFGAQFYGKRDMDGVRDCMRIKLLVTALFLVVGISLFLGFGNRLVGLYMDPAANTRDDIAATLAYSHTYLRIMLIGLVPFGLSMAVGSVSREAGRTVLNMFSSIAGVLTNFVLNYILIFGHFGAPKLGVAGAAIATVIARFTELAVISFGLWRNRHEFTFLKDVFRIAKLPGDLLKKVIIKGTPLTMNEILWSVGLAAISQCYSTRGLDAIASINITMTITNVFSILCMAFGMSISILVGQRLGAGKIEEAKDMDRKLLTTSVLVNVFCGTLLFLSAPLFPSFYNVSPHVKELASVLLRIAAVMLPLQAIYYGCYFTLRAGGKTVITFLFDSAYTVCVSLVIAFILTHFTSLPITVIYFCVLLADLPKAIIGLYLLHKGIWANNLVS